MQAAAIGAMFLTTMAGPVEATELALYSALLMDSSNSEMIEFLMAGMWILLRWVYGWNVDLTEVGLWLECGSY
jgi:hypothetical protein